MKILHTGDLHLGSRMEAKLPAEKAAIRQAELRDAFSRLVSYAEKSRVRAILLCGDVFDSDAPLPRDVAFFLGEVSTHPDIDFFYLRGNHDRTDAIGTDCPPNLRRFSDRWTSFRIAEGEETVAFSGIEITGENALSFADGLSLAPEDKNIVLLHGQVSDSPGKDAVVLSAFRGKNVDYLALGHIHSHSEGKLDGRGKWAYCGCPEGRGFDETGEKGFLLLDTANGLSPIFVPFAKRKIEKIEIDLSQTEDVFAAVSTVKKTTEAIGKENLLRIELTGEVGFDTEGLTRQIETALDGFFFVSAKDRTTDRVRMEDYAASLTLRGAFLRRVTSSGLPDGMKAKIIRMGLSALSGKK